MKTELKILIAELVALETKAQAQVKGGTNGAAGTKAVVSDDVSGF